VTAKDSTAAQVRVAAEWLATLDEGQRALLFVNVSATHPPHGHYLDGNTPGRSATNPSADSVESQMAALAYVDGCLPVLFAAMRRRGRWFCLVMADHGEAYGEDGRFGHRIAHPSVTTVPYAHFILD